jgi:hypothetical protein
MAFKSYLCGLLIAFCGCSAASSPTFLGSPEQPDGSTVDPGYCDRFCQAAENAGTLNGSYQDCLDQCCMMTPQGCGDMDSGVPTDDSTVPTGDGGGTDGTVCAHPCGTSCCNATQVCENDGAGHLSCSAGCTSSAQCPQSSPCCEVQSNGQGTCVPTNSGDGGTGVQACRCTTQADCSSGCCAPMTNSHGDGVGPYVCKPNDGANFDCCYGFTTCNGTGCCIQDTNSNEFCAPECTTSASCGAAHCQMYDFSFVRTTCTGPMACGP